DPSAFVRDLTIGQKQRLEIVKLLYCGADIIFLDEPTAVLSPIEKEEFFGVLRKLRSERKTIIIVTHKVAEVFAICDSFAVLRRGELVASGDIGKTNESEIVALLMGSQNTSVTEKSTSKKVTASGHALLSVN